VAARAEAKDRLARALPNGTKVELRFDERREDRHGHLVAQVYIIKGADRVWLQEALVAEGLARVYILPGTRLRRGAAGPRGRSPRARRGLWHSWAYRVRDATDVKGLGRLTQTYQVVQGTVHAVGESQKRLYVNFAPDWRNDFTIVIERKRLARFEAAGLDFDRLDGARVRVRGWVEWWNGPMIAASDPEQIEVLSPAPAM
jgi:micrococcal nuclease